MNFKDLAKKLKGLQTVSTVSKILNVDKRTAINYISKLRKLGYVKTSGGSKIRLYEISNIIVKKRGELGLYDFINKYSPIKLAKPYEHIIYDHQLTPEECIVRAIETKDYRVIIAALYLFKYINDWSTLYKLAKEKKFQRDIGALYDLAKKYFRVRRMDKRIRNKMLESKISHKFIIPNMKSKDFGEIEKIWKMHLPFNNADMRRYRIAD